MRGCGIRKTVVPGNLHALCKKAEKSGAGARWEGDVYTKQYTPAYGCFGVLGGKRLGPPGGADTQ